MVNIENIANTGINQDFGVVVFQYRNTITLESWFSSVLHALIQLELSEGYNIFFIWFKFTFKPCLLYHHICISLINLFVP